MQYLIAIDGGGTKTDIVLFDNTGRVIKRVLDKGCNPVDVGLKNSLNMLCTILHGLEKLVPEPVVSIFGGIAGHIAYNDAIQPAIQKEFPHAVVRAADDGIALMSGTLGTADSCGMICGTGSSFFIRKGNNPIVTIGGRGYLIDTGGSGYCLGRDAFYMAFKSLDKRVKPTMLVDILRDMTGLPVEKWQSEIYKGGRAYIASFSDAVFRGVKEGDWACREIFEHQSGLLAELTFPAEEYFEGEFPVVLSGGIFFAHQEYVNAVSQKSSKYARCMLATAPPIYGAAVEALTNLELAPSEEFRTLFLSTL